MLYIIYLFKDLSRPLWLLTLVNLINRCGAMIMCFLSLYITESLHYSLTEAGLAMSIYGIGAIIGQQIGGRLTDKIGYYKVQLLSLILTGCMILVLMEVRNFYVLCVVLFFLNLVSEAFRPANSAAITDYSVTENRTRSFALMRISFNLAITFALTIGGFLIKLSWSYIFWADAITCFMAAALLMFLMNPNSNMYIHRSPIEKQTVANSHFEPYKNPLFRNFVLATFINALVFMQLVWTLPQFFKQVYHWDESTIGIIAAINGFVVMLTEMPIVHGIEKLRLPTIRIVQRGVLIYAFSFALLALPPAYSYVIAVVYMITISFGETFVMPFSMTWASMKTPKGQEGQYLSAYGVAYAAANVIAPIIGTQLLYHFGYQALWLTITALAIVSYIYLKEIERQDNAANVANELQ